MLICLRLIILALTVCVSSLAQGAECETIFANGYLPVLLNARLAPRTTLLCNDAYATLFSAVTRGPLWSAEHLTAANLIAMQTMTRQGLFHEEERLPPDDRAALSDYTRSGYDRGHMAPSGDMPNAEAQQQSFSLANIVPQAPTLNRGTWEGIESAVRRIVARHGELYVVTGPVFQGRQLQSLKGRILVPTAIWKAIYDPRIQGTAAYMCTNVSHPNCTTLSIAALALRVGIDPFPGVSDFIKLTAMRLPPPMPGRYAPAYQIRHWYDVFESLFK